ncbi:RlmN [Caligus rogercresseyi]|uniref:RlmN n=1 Tax=Caligus rogercresseyi TaxID=217165 RepID=A0A7T8H2J4_CALRO|nr:RlmN [Caligus rogercresseyi]
MRTGPDLGKAVPKGVRGFRGNDAPVQGLPRDAGRDLRGEVPEVVSKQVSADGTRKYSGAYRGRARGGGCLYPRGGSRDVVYLQPGRLHDDVFVLHTGTQKLVRNLTAGEIIGQVMLARDDLDEWVPTGEGSDAKPRLVSNIVLMAWASRCTTSTTSATHEDRDGPGRGFPCRGVDHAVHLWRRAEIAKTGS